MGGGGGNPKYSQRDPPPTPLLPCTSHFPFWAEKVTEAAKAPFHAIIIRRSTRLRAPKDQWPVAAGVDWQGIPRSEGRMRGLLPRDKGSRSNGLGTCLCLIGKARYMYENSKYDLIYLPFYLFFYIYFFSTFFFLFMYLSSLFILLSFFPFFPFLPMPMYRLPSSEHQAAVAAALRPWPPRVSGSWWRKRPAPRPLALRALRRRIGHEWLKVTFIAVAFSVLRVAACLGLIGLAWA